MASVALALLVLGGGHARAALVVLPGAEASVDGDVENSFPFHLADGGLAAQRYQQVYAASGFSSLGGPVIITEIAFRPDAVFGSAFSTTLPSIQIDLSTTPSAVDGLSSAFANNVGANDVVVRSGPLTLSSAFTGPAAGPKDFDIVVPLTTPFLYNPALGNLLMDVRNFGGGATTFFDAESLTGDAVSRANTLIRGIGSPDADLVDSVGLVTRFTVTAATTVPEPATLALCSLGLAALGFLRRKQ